MPNETPLPFASLNFKVAWDEWLQFRKESKFKKYTSIGLKRTFTKLVNDSNGDEQTAIAILDHSMACNYQGLFPLKPNYVTGNTNHTTHKLSKHEAGITGTLKDLEEQLNAGGIPYM